MGRRAELNKWTKIAGEQNVPVKKRVVANEFKGKGYRTIRIKNKKTGEIKSIKGAGVYTIPVGWKRIREE